MRRFAIPILVAYAVSVTLLGAWWGMSAWFYRRFFDLLMRGKHGHPVAYSSYEAIVRDFGVELNPLEHVAVWCADVTGTKMAGIVLALASSAIAAGLLAKRRTTGVAEEWSAGDWKVLWWTRGAAIGSVLVGIVAFGVTFGMIRWRVLHPHYWPALVLFALQLIFGLVAVAAGFFRLARGPRRLGALGLLFVSLIPLGLWGGIGLYAWSNWLARSVPHDLPMTLATITGAALMRLEATMEYPDRFETDRLVMFHKGLPTARADAEAMDRHVARLEALIGSPLRSKIYWVRGELPRLGLGGLSVHGLAIGSDGKHDRGLGLDEHELAHATLDQYRTADSDPPYVLHEGWAVSQVGVAEKLAASAVAARDSGKGMSLRVLFGAEWYHRDMGPVYSMGGAFVDFLIRDYGSAAFLKVYTESRPESFEAVFKEAYQTDFDELETRFWAESKGLAKQK